MTNFLIFGVLVLCVSNGVLGDFGYQPNTGKPPKAQAYTGRPFVYSTTMNPTLNASNGRSNGNSNQNQRRNRRQMQFGTSTMAPFNNQNQFFNPNQQPFYNQQNMNNLYGPTNQNPQFMNQQQQYPYTNLQMAYNNGLNQQYLSTSTDTSYLLRDQDSNYNYRPLNYNQNSQAFFNPLSNQFSSPQSMNNPNGFGMNWNTNLRIRRRRQSQFGSQNQNFQTSTQSPFYQSSTPQSSGFLYTNPNNGFQNPQFDPNPRNADPSTLIQNPNYKYLTPGLENLYLSSYNRMYDPQSGRSNFPMPTTEPPILSNDAQNQLNYQKIQQDYVGGRDKYQQDNSDVTNNIYGYNYGTSSTQYGKK